jgi:lysophospholipase L1-like esterase
LLAKDWCNLPEQHAALIQADMGVEVNVVNLAVGGQSSEGLRRRVGQEYVRKAIGEADIIVISIGGNDSGELVAPYFEGRCGGSDNQDCLREGLAAFKGNWDAILAEVVALASPTDTVIRPIAIGGVSLDVTRRYGNSEGYDDFVSYAEAMRDHMVQSAAEYGIPMTGRSQLHDDLESQYIGPDGVHPNDEGIALLVGLLHDLGYEYGQ